MSGAKGIIGMHRFHISLVVDLSLSCSGAKTPLELHPQNVSNNQPENVSFNDISYTRRMVAVVPINVNVITLFLF